MIMHRRRYTATSQKQTALRMRGSQFAPYKAAWCKSLPKLKIKTSVKCLQDVQVPSMHMLTHGARCHPALETSQAVCLVACCHSVTKMRLAAPHRHDLQGRDTYICHASTRCVWAMQALKPKSGVRYQPPSVDVAQVDVVWHVPWCRCCWCQGWQAVYLGAGSALPRVKTVLAMDGGAVLKMLAAGLICSLLCTQPPRPSKPPART